MVNSSSDSRAWKAIRNVQSQSCQRSELQYYKCSIWYTVLGQSQYDLSQLKESNTPEIPQHKRGFRRYFSPVILSPMIVDKVENDKEDKPKPQPSRKFPDQNGEELEKLLNFVKVHGFGWKKISVLMSNRSENSLKNKFYGEVRKVLRVLNKLSVQALKKRSKPLKYESLIRVFSIAEDGGIWEQEIQRLAHELRETLCQLILALEKKGIQNIDGVIEKIEQFNKKTKHHAILKKKNLPGKINKMEPNLPTEQKEDLEGKQTTKSATKSSRESQDSAELNRAPDNMNSFCLTIKLQVQIIEQQMNNIM